MEELGGDDLEDNYAAESLSDGDEEVAAPAKAAGGAGQAPPQGAAPKKRKLEDGHAKSSSAPAPAAPPPTKYARPGPIEWATLDAAGQAESFWAAFSSSNAGKDLTALELGPALAAAQVMVAPPTAQDLPAVIKAMLPGWKKLTGYKHGQTPRPRGAPACLIITQSAGRATELLRALAPFTARAAKLFGGPPLAEQLAMLEGPPVIFAVGTPNRIQKVLESGPSPQGVSLTLQHVSLVLIDCKKDVKGYTVIDNPATKEDLFELYRRYLHPRIVPGGSSSSSSGSGGGSGGSSSSGKAVKLGMYY